MQFSRSFAELDPSLYKQCEPRSFSQPSLFLFNASLANELGFDQGEIKDDSRIASRLSGQSWFGNYPPLAFAYAGHQFGHFNPSLGDGRAHYLCELTDKRGCTFDLQLKGSGPTPFSRGGDGLCGLGPAVREFVMSEALHALGVPTTRSLSVVKTEEMVWRETSTPGAIVCRVAQSHMRVGTFQYYAYRGAYATIEKLVDYTLQRNFETIDNDTKNASTAERCLALLRAAIDRQVRLVCEWMRVGFIHGVMNTDNTLLVGDTIDFGPCAMMGTYDPRTTFSSIDHNKRYAFANQPDIAIWNIARFAECLIPLINKDDPEQAVSLLEPEMQRFSEQFNSKYEAMMARKMGFIERNEHTETIRQQWLSLMQTHKLDYTNAFNLLTEQLSENSMSVRNDEIDEFIQQWRKNIEAQAAPTHDIRDSMRKANPFIIPRNHLVEAVIQDCVNNGTTNAARDLISALSHPYERLESLAPLNQVSSDIDRGYMTYCGT